MLWLAGGAFGDVVDDLGGHELAPDAGLAFGTINRLRGLKMGDVRHLGRRDGAVNAFAEQFGVAVVGDQGSHRGKAWGRECAK